MSENYRGAMPFLAWDALRVLLLFFPLLSLGLVRLLFCRGVAALLFNAVEKESELIPATSCRECLIRLVKWCSVRSTCPV